MQGGAGAAGGGAGAAAAGPTPQQTDAIQYIGEVWGDPEGAVLGDDGKAVLEDLFGACFSNNFRFQKPAPVTPLHTAPQPGVPSMQDPPFPVD